MLHFQQQTFMLNSFVRCVIASCYVYVKQQPDKMFWIYMFLWNSLDHECSIKTHITEKYETSFCISSDNAWILNSPQTYMLHWWFSAENKKVTGLLKLERYQVDHSTDEIITWWCYQKVMETEAWTWGCGLGEHTCSPVPFSLHLSPSLCFLGSRKWPSFPANTFVPSWSNLEPAEYEQNTPDPLAKIKLFLFYVDFLRYLVTVTEKLTSGIFLICSPNTAKCYMRGNLNSGRGLIAPKPSSLNTKCFVLSVVA